MLECGAQFRLLVEFLKPFAQVTNADVQKKCPAFIGGGCPYSKLPQEKKGIAGKCPAFAKGACPFAKCKSVGEFQEKLGEMRDQCKGDGAYQEFLKAVVLTSKQKEVELGHGCPFFSKGCPFSHGKDILTPANAAVSKMVWLLIVLSHELQIQFALNVRFCLFCMNLLGEEPRSCRCS